MDVAEAYQACEEITWSQARNFAYGIRLLPAGKRQSLAALYAFARRIDDIGDGEMAAPDKLVALEQARSEVLSLAGPDVPGPASAPASAFAACAHVAAVSKKSANPPTAAGTNGAVLAVGDVPLLRAREKTMPAARLLLEHLEKGKP